MFEKKQLSIELIRGGEVIETIPFVGATHNAKAKAQCLAHEKRCTYRIKRTQIAADNGD